jgi:hypothetical protein
VGRTPTAGRAMEGPEGVITALLCDSEVPPKLPVMWLGRLCFVQQGEAG